MATQPNDPGASCLAGVVIFKIAGLFTGSFGVEAWANLTWHHVGANLGDLLPQEGAQKVWWHKKIWLDLWLYNFGGIIP